MFEQVERGLDVSFIRFSTEMYDSVCQWLGSPQVIINSEKLDRLYRFLQLGEQESPPAIHFSRFD